eukprot:26893-Pleurochrysis_carterae.AAC.1
MAPAKPDHEPIVSSGRFVQFFLKCAYRSCSLYKIPSIIFMRNAASRFAASRALPSGGRYPT